MSPEVSGSVWEGTGRVPELPGARFRFRPIFGYEEGPGGVKLRCLETEEGLRGVSHIFMADDCSSAPHGDPPARPPPFICTLFHTGIRACTALALHVAVMGSAVPSPATPPAPCCVQSTRSGLQQVRLLRKLMPGKGSYMDVLCYLLKAWKRCAVPAAIASCCHGCICALLASRLSSLTRYGACSLFMHSLQVSQPHSPQARRGV